MCQVHTGAYVSLLAPGKTDYTACHPRKTTTYILHVVPITTHTHDRLKSIRKSKQGKKRQESEKRKRKGKKKTRKARKDKKRKQEKEIEKMSVLYPGTWYRTWYGTWYGTRYGMAHGAVLGVILGMVRGPVRGIVCGYGDNSDRFNSLELDPPFWGQTT